MSLAVDFVNTMTTILDAGTWTNIGTKPSISSRDIEKKRNQPDTRLYLYNDADSCEQTFDGTVIVTALNGRVVLHTKSDDDQRKIEADLKAILHAAGYPYVFKNIPHKDNRALREISFNVSLLV